MNKEDIAETFAWIVLTILAVCMVVALVWAGIDSHRTAIAACQSDAAVLGVEYRYKDGNCLLQMDGGIWLPEHDYLLLAAVRCGDKP